MLLLMSWLACGESESHEEPAQAEAAHAEPAHAEHDAHAGHEGHAQPTTQTELVLTLNGSERWQMDEHTRTVMAESSASVRGAKLGSVEEAKALGATLKGQLDRLIQGCTMDGAAHDELHVFLMAWIPEVEGLAGATELEPAQASLARMQGMLVEYERTFE